MTGPDGSDAGRPPDPIPAAAAPLTAIPPDGGEPPVTTPPAAVRPGAAIFTIEGRRAPALFVVGWLATLMGFGIGVVGAVSGNAILLYVVASGLLAVGLIAGAGSQAIERRARGEVYAGPSPFLVFAAAIFTTVVAVAAIGVVIVSVLDMLRIGLPEPVSRLLAVTIQGAVFIGLVRLLVVGTDALSWRDMHITRPNREAGGHFGYGLLLAIPMIFATGVVVQILVSIVGSTPESPLPPTGTPVGLVVNLLAGAVIAPIAEEVLFRGFALTAWERTIGSSRAIVRSSLLFAVAHVIAVSATSLEGAAGLAAVGFIGRLPIAFALGWVFVRRRSIWAPIGLHVGFNAIPLILVEVYLAGQP